MSASKRSIPYAWGSFLIALTAVVGFCPHDIKNALQTVRQRSLSLSASLAQKIDYSNLSNTSSSSSIHNNNNNNNNNNNRNHHHHFQRNQCPQQALSSSSSSSSKKSKEVDEQGLNHTSVFHLDDVDKWLLDIILYIRSFLTPTNPPFSSPPHSHHHHHSPSPRAPPPPPPPPPSLRHFVQEYKSLSVAAMEDTDVYDCADLLDAFFERIHIFNPLPHTFDLFMPVKYCSSSLVHATTELCYHHYGVPIQQPIQDNKHQTVLHATIVHDLTVQDLLCNLKFYTQLLSTVQDVDIQNGMPVYIDKCFKAKLVGLMACEPEFSFENCGVLYDVEEQAHVAVGLLEKRIVLEKIPQFLMIWMERRPETKPSPRLRKLWDGPFFTKYNDIQQCDPPYHIQSILIDISSQPDLLRNALGWSSSISSSSSTSSSSSSSTTRNSKTYNNNGSDYDEEEGTDITMKTPPTRQHAVLFFDALKKHWWYTDQDLLFSLFSSSSFSFSKFTSNGNGGATSQQQQQQTSLVSANELVKHLMNVDSTNNLTEFSQNVKVVCEFIERNTCMLVLAQQQQQQHQ